MDEEPAFPRAARGAALRDLSLEDLDLYAVGDLDERIECLQAEIVRTRSVRDRKQAGRAAADAFFSMGR